MKGLTAWQVAISAAAGAPATSTSTTTTSNRTTDTDTNRTKEDEWGPVARAFVMEAFQRTALGDAARVRELVAGSGGVPLGATTHPPHDTLLHWAAGFGHGEVVRVLLALGADPRVRNDEGRTAVEEAGKGGHAGVVALLLEGGGGKQGPEQQEGGYGEGEEGVIDFATAFPRLWPRPKRGVCSRSSGSGGGGKGPPVVVTATLLVSLPPPLPLLHAHSGGVRENGCVLVCFCVWMGMVGGWSGI